MSYRLAQYILHKGLEAKQERLPNQLNKPTSRPSMGYVWGLFNNVQLLYLGTEEGIIEGVSNLSSLLKEIIGHFGIRAQTIYGLSS